MRVVSRLWWLLTLAACSSGSDGGGFATPPVTPITSVTVSGTVSYEFVPPNAGCNGLDFGSTVTRPIRAATVELIDTNTGLVIGTTVSDDTGNYSFRNVEMRKDVRLRVRAESKKSGSPGWDVEVRDNFIAGASDLDVPAPPALGSRSLYALDGTQFSTGTANVSRNLTATTGWGVSSYTSARAAAPFAILDTIYSGMKFVLATDPTAVFPSLDVFWNVNNRAATPADIVAGDLPTTFYSLGDAQLFLLGDAATDTDEFDDHIILHEWGHYFEDMFARSDSPGGTHALGEHSDARLAFSEGWASALAAMALNEPVYCDTRVPGTSSGSGYNAETSGFGTQGWFNEVSITTLLYDLWDTDNDGADTGSLGFAPIYNTMLGPQLATEAFATVFSFAATLQLALPPTEQAFLYAQLVAENIETIGLDKWGSTESNSGGASEDVIPVYTDMTADGTVTNICSNRQFDSHGDGNKLSEYRYLRVNVPAQDKYDVSIRSTTATPATPDPNDADQSDPDMFVYHNGTLVAYGNLVDPNVETFTTQELPSGLYVADLRDWRFSDANASPTYPARVCFDVAFSPTP